MVAREASLLLLLAAPLTLAAQELTTVPRVDLDRYAGLWHEIARIPNRFQRRCTARTTAEYSLLPDGRIRVVNRCCTAGGEEISATGVARVVDAQSNSKLEVSFVRFLGRNWFYGDYWIIGLDPDYRWAIVGAPGRRYGWILARDRTLSAADRAQCDQILRQRGYDPGDFVDSPQQ